MAEHGKRVCVMPSCGNTARRGEYFCGACHDRSNATQAAQDARDRAVHLVQDVRDEDTRMALEAILALIPEPE